MNPIANTALALCVFAMLVVGVQPLVLADSANSGSDSASTSGSGSIGVADSAPANSSSSSSSNQEPVWKSDVPKMDLTLPPQRMLKGGVHHREALDSQKLSSGASSAQGKATDSKLLPGAAKGGVFNQLFKAKIKQAPPLNSSLSTSVSSSMGIIGVRFVMTYGRAPTINRVFPGMPAQHCGLRVNDVIVAVDGVPTNGLTKEEVYGMIVGRPGTPVTLSVVRNGDFMARSMNRMDFNDIPDPAVRRDYLSSM